MKQSTIIIGVVIVLVVVGAIFFMGSQQSNNSATSQANTTANATMAENKPVDASEAMMQPSDKTIVEIASENPDFSTLVTAIKTAGLVETLSGEGPFTVFAPTNAAFEKLPAGTLEALLQDKAQLTKVLTYHVVPNKVMAKDVVGLTSATTVEGSDVAVKVDGSTVMINNATVVTTDIEASNGVIHVIDTVLLPQ